MEVLPAVFRNGARPVADAFIWFNFVAGSGAIGS